MNAPLTHASDPRRELPTSNRARRDVIAAAIESLLGEQRRLERLGFELPLARCADQLRYWRFLSGLYAAAESKPTTQVPSRSWRVDGSR